MSEVQYPDNVLAGGSILGATAAVQAGSRGIAGVVRSSAGVYVVSLVEQVDRVEYRAVASLIGASGGAISCEPQATDGTLLVRTWTVSGGGSGPEVIGSIDGVTVPGTPTFTGSGISAIVEEGGAAGTYVATLATAIDLVNGAGCEGVLLTSPIEAHDGAVPPGAAVGAIIRYEVIDSTHLRFICQSNMLTAKDAKFGVRIDRFVPAPSAGGLVAADLDFALCAFRLNVNNN